MNRPPGSVSLYGRRADRLGAADGGCEAPSAEQWHQVGIALDRATLPSSGRSDAPLAVLSGARARHRGTANSVIVGAGLLNVVLAFPAAFAAIGLHVASYMRVVGKDRAVSHQRVAAVFVLALVVQGAAGLLTPYAVRLAGERVVAFAGCSGVALCLGAAGWWLHDFWLFVLWYGVGAGFCSGLAMWLPAEAVLKLNPGCRGFACGAAYALMGLVLMGVQPLQLSYLGGWWEGAAGAGGGRPPPPSWPAPSPGARWIYVGREELGRTRLLIMYMAIAYELLTLVGVRCAFAGTPPEDEPPPQHTSEYVPFAIKGEVSHRGGEGRRVSRRWDVVCAWLLSYAVWQGLIYTQSYWRNTAVLEYGVGARGIVTADLLVRSASLVGRVLWGLVLETHGWRVTWAAVSVLLLGGTVVLTHLYHASFALYVCWVATVYFANSAIFCAVPLTAHCLGGSEDFTSVIGVVGTSRAFAGVTAMLLSLARPSGVRHWVPRLVSLLSVCNLVVVSLVRS